MDKETQIIRYTVDSLLWTLYNEYSWGEVTKVTEMESENEECS